MPLHEPARIEELRRSVAQDAPAIFRNIRLPLLYFESPAAGADLLLKSHAVAPRRLALLVEAAVRYRGADEGLRLAFQGEVVRGWRRLADFPFDVDRALEWTDMVLGLTGRAPQIPEFGPNEIVVDPGEIDPEKTPAEVGAPVKAGVDLVEEARRGRIRRALFREDAVQSLMRILSKEGKNAAVLLGEPGVGKTAVMETLALNIADGRVPSQLAKASLWAINLGQLTAGAKFQNEQEGRFEEILDRARKDPNVILFLDELHTLRSLGGNLAQMIKADLGRGRIRCVGATTNEEFRQIEADPALARRFQPVPVLELSPAQTVEVLREYRRTLEAHHAVRVPVELLQTTVDLAVRYVPNRYLPDKALDLLDEACAAVGLERVVPQSD